MAIVVVREGKDMSRGEEWGRFIIKRPAALWFYDANLALNEIAQ